jgi:hypothetical protein
MSGTAIAKGKMTNDQAKEILQLYRPGTADAADPAFAEALELCERNPDLKNWFGNHCALYSALRSKFKQIAVPEGLKEQIIAERRVRTAAPLWQRAVIAVGAVAVVVMVVFNLVQNHLPGERIDFGAYRDYMGRVASASYGMDLNSTDLDQIRLFFAQKNAVADYVLPDSLKSNAKAVGCVATTWQGKEVSMICFRSGRQLPPGRESDLWLFISDRTIAKGAPSANTPAFHRENEMVSASWTVGNRTYVLTAQGDEQFLGKFVPAKAVL